MNKTKSKITPTPGYVLIEPMEATKKLESGIYLPETSDEKPQKGKVLAVGENEVLDSGKTKKSPVKKGDVVIYKKWGGSEVKVDRKELLFSKFEDILAVIN
jgi:chaperonin GroES